MRKVIQPLLTFTRWCICHFKIGRFITKLYKEGRDRRRRNKACMRLQRWGWEILEKVERALRNTKSECFVDYGTLLGLVRDNGFIKHDDDIDFSLPIGGIEPLRLLSLMLENGFTFLRAFLWRGYVTEITFVYKKVEVDFFYILKDDEGTFYSLVYDLFTVIDGEHVAQKITQVDKPDCITSKVLHINGTDIPVPVDATRFLEYNYGRGWGTPVKNFRTDGLSHRRQIEGRARMFVTLIEFTEYLSTKS